MGQLVSSIDDLFMPDVRWIAVMNRRGCDSGLMAFGYPERRYGFDTYKIIELDEIPILINACESRGYQLDRIDDNGQGYRGFTYRYPGAKWWMELATVKDGVLIPAE